jgi:hypothetical protein
MYRVFSVKFKSLPGYPILSRTPFLSGKARNHTAAHKYTHLPRGMMVHRPEKVSRYPGTGIDQMSPEKPSTPSAIVVA